MTIVSRKRNQAKVKKDLNTMLQKASGKPGARITFTDRWHYENPYHAVIKGLPRPLPQCVPSEPVGGWTTTSKIRDALRKHKISISILSPEAFERRCADAIASEAYTVMQPKGRSDAGYPRPYMRKAERLYPAMNPNTAEVVTEEMEAGTYVYPPRSQPRRVSNVERKKREAKAAEDAAVRRRASLRSTERKY
ncbi:hypothetical protein PsYK624_084930 [Phanerochaete sordida]|uniref:Uncharacterized protein n=1 Tax=Phanerochaete sordida TaxID=48140 RepID=A0A9P3GDH3_9APHY|nr:hypothetical protein PsYK624_084930 [Phanerochaete sordida]